MASTYAPPYSEEYARKRSLEAIYWSRYMVSENSGNWVVLDSETSGLDDQAEIIDLAIVSKKGEILFNELMQPVREISPEASRIHGITAKTLAEKLSYFEHIPRIMRALHRGDPTVLIYNAEFDTRMLRQTAALYGLASPLGTPNGVLASTEVQVSCVMKRYSEYVGEWNYKYGGFRWQKLPPILGETAHTALGDCRATLALLERMATSGA